MGGLEGCGLLLDFFRPGLIKLIFSGDADRGQMAATPINVTLPFPVVKGCVNLRDGLVYLAGFQLEGSRAAEMEGIGRLRPRATDDWLPVSATVVKSGVVLRFRERIVRTLAESPANFRAHSWSDRRSSAYGYAQYDRSGEPGIDRHAVPSVWPGPDGKSVFIAIADLTPARQLEVQFDLGEGWSSVYLSPARLADFAAEDRKFAQLGFPARFATAPAQRAETSDGSVGGETGPYREEREPRAGATGRFGEEEQTIVLIHPARERETRPVARRGRGVLLRQTAPAGCPLASPVSAPHSMLELRVHFASRAPRRHAALHRPDPAVRARPLALVFRGSAAA